MFFNPKWLNWISVGMLSLTLSACGSQQTTSNQKYEVEAPASPFPEKDIELIVGYKPGGGYSDWALAIAPFIEKHLPNKVNVKVRHMEGAGSATAANYIHNAKPDGYTIGIYNSGLILTQLAADVKYDLKKNTWLARLSRDSQIAAVSTKSPYKSIEDFKKQDKESYIMSTKGLAANATINGAITLQKLGNIKWEPLNHDGTGETVLSVIRGDSDITWGAYDSLKQYVENGDLKPLLYYDDQRNPELPEVPIPGDIGIPELNTATNTQRLLGAPPGLPKEVGSILEEAIKKAVEDPEFQAVLQKMKLSSQYLNGEDTAKLVDETFHSLEQYVQVVKDLQNREKE